MEEGKSHTDSYIKTGTNRLYLIIGLYQCYPMSWKSLKKHFTHSCIRIWQQNGLISPHQSGFRPFHSTSTVLCDVNDYLLHNIEMGHITGALYLDLKGEIRNRFNLISEEREKKNQTKQSKPDENWLKNEEVMNFSSFANFHETFLDQSIWICKWVSWWCHCLTTCHIFCI